MKILTIAETLFNLPDSFEGNVPAALRALADFLESDTKPLKGRAKNEPPKPKITKEVWDDFIDTIDRGGKLRGVMSTQEYDTDVKRWDIMSDSTDET